MKEGPMKEHFERETDGVVKAVYIIELYERFFG